MPSIEAAHTTVGFLTDWHFRELIAATANQMTKRVTTESVTSEHDGVHRQNDRPYADAERDLARRCVCEPHRLPCVVQEDDDEQQGEIQKVSMDVLENQRERALPSVMFSRLAYGARRRIRPERLIVGSAVVVAGQSKSAGRPENDQRGRPG